MGQGGEWLLSEKMDGVRAFLERDGTLVLRGGKRLSGTPFKSGMDVVDGELISARYRQLPACDRLGAVLSVIQSSVPDWRAVSFVAFDVPVQGVPFADRLQQLRRHCKVPFVDSVPVSGAAQVSEQLRRVKSSGGEGVVVRRPDSLYKEGRTSGMRKAKGEPQTRAALVVGANRTGGVTVRWRDNGVQFDVRASKQLDSGTHVTVAFTCLNRSGKPQHARIINHRSKRSPS